MSSQDRGFDQALNDETEWLHHVTARWIRDLSAVEDIVQETVIKAWRNQGSYVPTEPLRPWLYTIAKRVAFDHTRHRRPEPVPDDDLQQPAAPETDPAVTIQAAQLADGIAIASAHLSRRYQRVLEYRFSHGLTYQQIAELEDLSIAAVKPLVSRARHAFRAAYSATGLPTRIGSAAAAFRVLRQRSPRPHPVPAAAFAATAMATILALTTLHLPHDPRGPDTQTAQSPDTELNTTITDHQRALLTGPPATHPRAQLPPAADPAPVTVTIDPEISNNRIGVDDSITASDPTTEEEGDSLGTGGNSEITCLHDGDPSLTCELLRTLNPDRT